MERISQACRDTWCADLHIKVIQELPCNLISSSLKGFYKQDCPYPIHSISFGPEDIAENAWLERIQPADFRGLTPLLYSHINPYGRLDLIMHERIII